MKHLCTIACILLVSFCFGQFDHSKMDSLFNTLATNNKAMGSVAITKNGKTVYARAFGNSLIDSEKKQTATTETKYRIGSITKMFTCVMIFQLIEEKKLSLDTKLNQFFPSVPNSEKITIAQLLDHHSGIHNFTDDEDYLKWNTKPKTQKEMIELISKSKSEFEPGSKAAYSNSNFVLLGYIIEQLTGKSYKENLDKRIISRIGLKNTEVGGKINSKKNESFSYHFAGKWEPESETDMSIPGGAGSIISTPLDLTKFADALFTNHKLVSDSSLAKMKNIHDGYGFGMVRFPFYDKRAFGHTGGIDGFSSILSYFPADTVAMAYISNGQVYPMNDVLIGVLSIYYGKPYQIPDFNVKPVTHTEMELEQMTGTYSSSQIPLKLTINRNGLQLTAQATGQSPFPLQSNGKNRFQFDPAGIEIEFYPDKKELSLYQGGENYRFSKEK